MTEPSAGSQHAEQQVEQQEAVGVRKAPSPSRRRTVIVLMTVLVALSVSGGVALWHLFLRAPTATLSRYAPKDAELYVEVVDVKRFALSVVASDAVAANELEADKQLGRLADALADGFGLDDADAERMLASVDSVAVVGRSLEPIGERFERRPEAALLVRFSSAVPLAAIRGSARFEEEARFFGAEELRLRPAKEPLDDEPRHWGEMLARLFESIQSPEDADTPKKDRRAPLFAVVLVASENLLIVGSRDLALDVTRVAAGDKSSLDENDRFRAASWERGATVVAFFEPTVSVTAREDFFRDVPAWSGAARVSADGLVTTAWATFQGNAIHEDAFLPEASSLEVVSRLPDRTFAYAALSLAGKGPAKEKARDLVATVDALHPRSALEFHRALLAYERELGGTLPLLFEATGGAVVVGLAADEVPAPSDLASRETFFEHATIVGVLEVGDADAAEKVLADVRTAIERELSASHTSEGVAGGFMMRPRPSSSDARAASRRVEPTIRITIEARKHVLVLIGLAADVEDYADAFAAGGSIDENAAHAAARAALPGSLTALAWADTGLLLASELAHDKAKRRALTEASVPVGALRLEGRRRLTSAMGVVLSHDGDAVEVESVSLNAPLVLALAGLLTQTTSEAPRPPKQAPKKTEGVTGIAECDEYLKALADCAKAAPAAVRDALLQSAASFRDSIKNTPDPIVMRGVCSTASKALKESGSCGP